MLTPVYLDYVLFTPHPALAGTPLYTRGEFCSLGIIQCNGGEFAHLTPFGKSRGNRQKTTFADGFVIISFHALNNPNEKHPKVLL